MRGAGARGGGKEGGRPSRSGKVAARKTPARVPGPETKEEHTLTEILPNRYGLHMRPAKELVELANSFPCEITLAAKGRAVDAKSILGVIGLGAECGEEVEVRALGVRAKEAARAVAAFLASLAEPRGGPKGKKAK